MKQFLLEQEGRTLDYYGEHLDRRILKSMLAWMRSDMARKDSHIEEAWILYGSRTGNRRIYLCMERADMEPGEHVYQVWACDTANMESREITGERRVVLEKEVMGCGLR